MFFAFIFLIVLKIVISITPLMPGGWYRGSFDQNTEDFTKAFFLANSTIQDKFTSKVSIIPCALYTQTVNGYNYLFILGVLDSDGNIKLTVTSIYNGLPTNNGLLLKNFTEITNFQSDAQLSSTDRKILNFQISNYLNNNTNTNSNSGSSSPVITLGSLSVVIYPNVFSSDTFYVVKTSVLRSGLNQNKSFIVILFDDDTSKVYKVIDLPVSFSGSSPSIQLSGNTQSNSSSLTQSSGKNLVINYCLLLILIFI